MSDMPPPPPDESGWSAQPPPEPDHPSSIESAAAGTGPEPSGNGLAIAGFVTALGAIVLFWIPLVNIILWVLGLVFSALGLKRANRGAPHRGLAIAGLWIAIAAAILSVLLVVLFVGAVNESLS